MKWTFFFVAGQSVFVEEIDESGATVMMAEGNLEFIPRITATEKTMVQKIWAEKKYETIMQSQLAAIRSEEEKKFESVTTLFDLHRTVNNQPEFQVVIKKAPRIFYGTEFAFPSAFKVCPAVYAADGRLVAVPFVLPCQFKTFRCGVSINTP